MAHPIQEKVWGFLEEPRGIPARIVQISIILLVLASAILFGVEHFSPKTFNAHKSTINGFETAIVIIFIIEYLLRLWAAPSKRKFVTNFYSIIDLAAILPFFFTASGLGFIRSVRLLRLLRAVRLLRVAKVLRPLFGKKTADGVNVLRIVQENVVKNLVVLVVLLTAHHSIADLLRSVPAENYGDILFGVSIVSVAAMFGFFSLSYGDMNPFSTFERFMVHLTTIMLLVPIGLTFMVIQEMLVIELPQYPTILVMTIWFVYTAVVLWDFWNVKRVANKIVVPAAATTE